MAIGGSVTPVFKRPMAGNTVGGKGNPCNARHEQEIILLEALNNCSDTKHDFGVRR